MNFILNSKHIIEVTTNQILVSISNLYDLDTVLPKLVKPLFIVRVIDAPQSHVLRRFQQQWTTPINFFVLFVGIKTHKWIGLLASFVLLLNQKCCSRSVKGGYGPPPQYGPYPPPLYPQSPTLAANSINFTQVR